MSRRMHKGDLNEIQKIINLFKSKPTWPLITERSQANGLPFSEVTLKRNPDIIAMKKQKDLEFKEKRAKAKGIPRNDPKIATKLENLKKENEELKTKLRAAYDHIERIRSAAQSLGIPEEKLDRPIANMRGSN